MDMGKAFLWFLLGLFPLVHAVLNEDVCTALRAFTGETPPQIHYTPATLTTCTRETRLHGSEVFNTISGGLWHV